MIKTCCFGRGFFKLAGQQVPCPTCRPTYQEVRRRRTQDARNTAKYEKLVATKRCVKCGSPEMATKTLCVGCCSPKTAERLVIRPA